MPPSAVTYSVIRHTWHAKQISALPQESTGWERGGLVVEEWKTGEVTLGARAGGGMRNKLPAFPPWLACLSDAASMFLPISRDGM